MAMATAWHRLDRTALTRSLVATRGWPLVHAVDASGMLDWLTQHDGVLTHAAIAAELRRRLPVAVLLRAHQHAERWRVEGPAHRCADCAFR